MGLGRSFKLSTLTLYSTSIRTYIHALLAPASFAKRPTCFLCLRLRCLHGILYISRSFSLALYSNKISTLCSRGKCFTTSSQRFNCKGFCLMIECPLTLISRRVDLFLDEAINKVKSLVLRDFQRWY